MNSDVLLNFTTLWANLADDKLVIVFLFFTVNIIRHFMQIVSLLSHKGWGGVVRGIICMEFSKHIFLENTPRYRLLKEKCLEFFLVVGLKLFCYDYVFQFILFAGA